MEELVILGRKYNLKLLTQSIANAGPEQGLGRIGNNRRVDKAMVAGFGGEITAIAATRIVHNGLRRKRSTVRAHGWEGKEGLIHEMRCIFYSINGTTATHSKDDICLLYGRQLHQHMTIFVGAFSTIPNKVQNLDIGAGYALNNSILSLGKSCFTTNNNNIFAQKACCMGNLLIGIGANRIG